MIRLDYLLLGYKNFTVDCEDIGRSAEIFLKNRVSVRFNKNTFIASKRQSKVIEKLLAGHIKYSVSELLGFAGFVYRNRKRYGVMAATLLTLIIAAFSSDRVWDVRVEVEDAALAEKIESELSGCGFRVGTSWSDTDLSKIEVDVLSKSDSISWLNINRRGTVAYISVIKKDTQDEPEKKEGYSNVVASCDAVIEEITVLRGVATVKAGDVVKKGDLLISGVIPSELGGGFCYAEGIVIGRISDSIEVSVSNFHEVKKTEKPKILACKLKIFNFSLNIFDFNKKISEECDIIENEEGVFIFKKEIPIAVYKKSAVPYQKVSVSRSAEEMVAEASSKMSESLNQRLSESTLVRISTSGDFSDSAYVMKSSFVCLEKIGTDKPFEVNREG